MKMKNMDKLFEHELQDIYHAEKQLLNALPKAAQKVSAQEARSAFEEHEMQTREQVKRLEQVFEILGLKPKASKCKAMEGLIEEAEDLMKEGGESDVLDAGIIAGAQKMEHYEIASYGTLATWAEMMGKNDVAELLKQNLDEEEKTDQKLTKLAKDKINRQAMEA